MATEKQKDKAAPPTSPDVKFPPAVGPQQQMAEIATPPTGKPVPERRQNRKATPRRAAQARPDTKNAPRGISAADPAVVPPEHEKGLAQKRILNPDQAQDVTARKIEGLKGKRREEGIDPKDAKPGDYWHSDQHWYGCTPNGVVTRLDNLRPVNEHADRTISVEPSLDLNPAIGWQGDLRYGVWIHQ